MPGGLYYKNDGGCVEKKSVLVKNELPTVKILKIMKVVMKNVMGLTELMYGVYSQLICRFHLPYLKAINRNPFLIRRTE